MTPMRQVTLTSDDFGKIRFRLVWELAAQLDAAREADKQGHPDLKLGDGWREQAEETRRLIRELDKA
ncbi:hypothetical protein, partial [Mesorhizobium sp. M8A.F.Ca.ET.167.01.1.1]